jgi:hypothetical protein
MFMLRDWAESQYELARAHIDHTEAH